MVLLGVEETQKKIKYLKQRHFEFANKLGRYLAHCLRKQREKRRVPGIWKENQIFYSEQKMFKQIIFFSDLYKKESIDEEGMDNYLSETPIKGFTSEQ